MKLPTDAEITRAFELYQRRFEITIAELGDHGCPHIIGSDLVWCSPTQARAVVPMSEVRAAWSRELRRRSS